MDPPQINSDSEAIVDADPGATIPTVDYETPAAPKRKSWPFWVVFWASYFPGLLILNTIDDIFHRHLTGHPNDGGIMFLSLFCSPLVAGAAGVVKQLFPRYWTLPFAAAFAVLAPIILYLAWVALDVL